jgi:hypothetical protein
VTIGAPALSQGPPGPLSEDGARRDRIRPMYQLPLRRAAARVLIVGNGATELAQDWPGTVSVWPLASIAEALRDPDPSTFDAVAVPDLSGTAGPRSAWLLAELSCRLVTGGVLAGSARRSWVDRHGLRAADLRNLKAALEGAGLVDVECYLVQPSIDDPMALIPAAPDAARAHFRRQLDCARPRFSTAGYALRRIAIACGLGGRRHEALFFWARRPC